MNRRKKKNTRANLYRGGDGKSYYEANKRRRMSRYIKVGSTILITLLLALSIMKISGRGIFAQRAYSELSDEAVSYTHLDVYKRQFYVMAEAVRRKMSEMRKLYGRKGK